MMRSLLRVFLLVAAVMVPVVAQAQSAVSLDGADGKSSAVKVSTALDASALRAGGRAVMAVVLEIQRGYHAQSNKPLDKDLIKTEVTVEPSSAVKVGTAVYPAGEVVEYPALGKLSVYTGRVVIYVPLEVKADAPVGPIKLKGQVDYQVCDEASCYPPQTTPITLETTIAAPGETVKGNATELFKGYKPAGHGKAAPPVSLAGSDGVGWGVGYAFGMAFLAGLLFNVMPCVLPVMPLKAMGFYEVSQHHRGKCMVLGAIFSLGVVAFFAGIALIILVFKVITWGEQFSNPWFVWGVVAILVLMAMGMFGAFNVNLPTAVYRFTPRHDTYTGNFLFGVFTGILSTPCTAPLFPPLMLWAHSQPMVLGVPAVMMVGVGMAAPYFVLSAFPSLARKFPRTGAWSELVKQMMGFLLLIAATFFAAGQVIDGPGFWWIVVAMVAVASVFLVARTAQLSKSALGVGVASVIAVAMLGAAMIQTVAVTGILRGQSIRETAAAKDSHGGWVPYSPEALAEATKQNKIALVKFTANWCANCQTIESSVFGNAHTWAKLQEDGVVLLKADMTRENPKARELLLKLNPTGGIP
ncbi:MAG TPA: protein-disulfide reductase DsbD domain-containing protein, partial [Tepidisphaeraceae bacterium]|nr:protein-disulfide reductase DsbD domain-containing protein [Tepidisphaeraceae bacterium]